MAATTQKIENRIYVTSENSKLAILFEQTTYVHTDREACLYRSILRSVVSLERIPKNQHIFRNLMLSSSTFLYMFAPAEFDVEVLCCVGGLKAHVIEEIGTLSVLSLVKLIYVDLASLSLTRLAIF